MYIKQIIIQGFKSYKDKTIVDPFSPKHNVIVGRNGSGKSNFFAAIRFVLGDQYTQMGREERNALLHEGAGSAVMSAYVEIIFDNEEDRFHTNTPEVVLRRSIGLKKDEYTLNHKNTTRVEVQNLLETAGFSKSNPYYIVPQGRITHITNMKDSERLHMLKEVAGTHVYEQRRLQSLRDMEAGAKSREQINAGLEDIRRKLAQLEADKDELREYQEADAERRCLEYTIYNRESEVLKEALTKLVNDREGGVDQNQASQDALQAAEQQLKMLENQIEKLQQNLKLLSSERAQFERDRNDAAKEKAAIEYELKTLQDGQQVAQLNRQQQEADLQDVESSILQREQELVSLQPSFEAKSEQARQLRQQIDEHESTRQILLAKQGRSAKYRSKRERDDDLKQQVADVTKQLQSCEQQASSVTKEVKSLDQQIQQSGAEVASMRERLQNRGTQDQEIAAQVQRFKDEKAKLQEQRTELWRSKAKNDIEFEEARREAERSERALGQMMDQNTSRGLAAIRRYVQQYNIEGVYGTVGELMSFSDKFKTAVEVVAGTSLFHVIVDTDATATKLVELLQKEKAGRITFMPLNRLHPKVVKLPQNVADALPLLGKLRFDETYTKAYEQVFGKTVVCPELKTASHYARTYGVSAITPGGDRSNRKGALSGGYHDTKSSRVDGLQRAKTARENLEALNEQQAQTQSELDALEQRLTKAASELQKIEHQRLQAENGYVPMRQEMQRKEQESFRKTDDRDAKRRQLDNISTLGTQLRQQLDGFKQELSSPFTKALTDQEDNQLQTSSHALPGLRAQWAQLSSELSDIEERKKDIELELRENLRPRLDQLQAQAVEETVTGDSTNLKSRQKDLERATKKLESWTKRLQKQGDAVEKLRQDLINAQEQQQEQRITAEDHARAIENIQKSLQKSAQKRRAVQNRLDEVEASIRELGALPSAATQPPYTTMQNHTATVRLHKAQDALKKFGHVNKKAFEQFTQYNQKRELLESQQTSLGKSGESIRELIDYLDQQKDEAIERTFRQVSKHFAEMFEKLVPAGKGRLVIQRRADRAQTNGNASDGEEDGAQHGIIENYFGVGITVSFNSKHDEQSKVQQLSGGQKTLCALTLIFAIQASDPAPFYLFDEIDAALDAQYRTAVANLIQESAAGRETIDGQRAPGGQFICTTFRPEMLRVADKCYGVSSQGKASLIKPVETDEALDFVEGQVAATS